MPGEPPGPVRAEKFKPFPTLNNVATIVVMPFILETRHQPGLESSITNGTSSRLHFSIAFYLAGGLPTRRVLRYSTHVDWFDRGSRTSPSVVLLSTDRRCRFQGFLCSCPLFSPLVRTVHSAISVIHDSSTIGLVEASAFAKCLKREEVIVADSLVRN